MACTNSKYIEALTSKQHGVTQRNQNINPNTLIYNEIVDKHFLKHAFFIIFKVKIRFLIFDPLGRECIQLSACGY